MEVRLGSFWISRFWTNFQVRDCHMACPPQSCISWHPSVCCITVICSFRLLHHSHLQLQFAASQLFVAFACCFTVICSFSLLHHSCLQLQFITRGIIEAWSTREEYRGIVLEYYTSITRGIIEAWRTLQTQTILRASAPFREHGRMCQPADERWSSPTLASAVAASLTVFYWIPSF